MAPAPPFDLQGKRIWIAGHRGMVGSALWRRLAGSGAELLAVDSARLDLRDPAATAGWLRANRPDGILLAAGRVGGIAENAARPASLMRDNLAIAQSVLWSAHEAGVPRLVYLGASCVYPREAAQPITEASLLTGPLEPTNEGYALAKIAGMRLCALLNQEFGRAYVSVVPANLYGPGDRAHADPERAHVIPALFARMRAARQAGAAAVTIWGTGRAVRDFLHVDDAADATVHAYRHFHGPGHLNAGSGTGHSIAELAEVIAEIAGYRGRLEFDAARPDGMPRKVLDNAAIAALGWRPTIPLAEGLRRVYGTEAAAK